MKKLDRKTEELGHSEKGLSAILAKPWVYNLFSNFVGRKRTRVMLVQKYVRPFPGCRILEIGCGTASILSHLPDSIGEYVGFDMNPSYVEYAVKRWGDRPNCRFFCQKVEEAAIRQPGYYDIVLAIGVVHHLKEDEANCMFHFAREALKTNGVLVTYDNVYVQNQNRFAKWLIAKDRGRAVRTVEGYTRIGAHYFVDIEGEILHDALRIPYTIFVMRCIKSIINEQSS